MRITKKHTNKHLFSKNQPLCRFFHRVAMSVYLSPFHVFFQCGPWTVSARALSPKNGEVFRIGHNPPPALIFAWTESALVWSPKNGEVFQIIYFFADKSCNISKILSVLLSASVKRFFVFCMRDFLFLFRDFIIYYIFYKIKNLN